mmetsp:Transcript_6799/g.14504  ORF Transcript_6799/g.14504 Transcript_6799/m.14504 type:complete len:626 (+) Transcript_6799:43-1920(+)
MGLCFSPPTALTQTGACFVGSSLRYSNSLASFRARICSHASCLTRYPPRKESHSLLPFYSMRSKLSSSSPKSAAPNTERVRHVVTVFVCHTTTRESQGEHVLLLKRSAQVGSYQHHWAAVSGTIEHSETPREAALRELKEETALIAGNDEKSTVKIVRAGPAHGLDVRDDLRRSTWVVHPFLVRIYSASFNEPPEIQLDWEHERAEWVAVNKVEEFMHRQLCVPKLLLAFRRVFLPRAARQCIAQISHDRTSGAAQMAADVVRALAHTAREVSCGNMNQRGTVKYEDVVHCWETLAWYAASARPAMSSALLHACVHALILLENQRDSQSSVVSLQLCVSCCDEALARIDVDCEEVVASAKTALLKLAAGLKSTQLTIMTHSLSSVVVSVLLGLVDELAQASDEGRKLKEVQNLEALCVIVTESRPLFEGVELARRVHEHARLIGMGARVKTQIVTDAQMMVWVGGSDVVLLGADHVTEDGSVVNKVGSAVLAECAHSKHTPVWVAAPSSKRIVRLPPEPFPLNARVGEDQVEQNAREMEEKSGMEVTQGVECMRWLTNVQELKNLEVRNVYFEQIQPSRIASLISETSHPPDSNTAARLEHIREPDNVTQHRLHRFFAPVLPAQC